MSPRHRVQLELTIAVALLWPRSPFLSTNRKQTWAASSEAKHLRQLLFLFHVPHQGDQSSPWEPLLLVMDAAAAASPGTHSELRDGNNTNELQRCNKVRSHVQLVHAHILTETTVCGCKYWKWLVIIFSNHLTHSPNDYYSFTHPCIHSPILSFYCHSNPKLCAPNSVKVKNLRIQYFCADTSSTVPSLVT